MLGHELAPPPPATGVAAQLPPVVDPVAGPTEPPTTVATDAAPPHYEPQEATVTTDPPVIAPARSTAVEAAPAAAPAIVVVDSPLTEAPAPPPPPPPPVGLLDQAYAAAAIGDYESVVRLAARDAGIDEGTFVRIARCESGFTPTAHNPSGASGLLQQMARYWDGRAELYGFAGADVFDPVANAFVSARMARDQGFGPWECW